MSDEISKRFASFSLLGEEFENDEIRHVSSSRNFGPHVVEATHISSSPFREVTNLKNCGGTAPVFSFFSDEPHGLKRPVPFLPPSGVAGAASPSNNIRFVGYGKPRTAYSEVLSEHQKFDLAVLRHHMADVFELNLPDESYWEIITNRFLEEGCVGCPAPLHSNPDADLKISDFLLLNCVTSGCIHVAHHQCVYAVALIDEAHKPAETAVPLRSELPPARPPGGQVFVAADFKHVVSGRALLSMAMNIDPERVRSSAGVDYLHLTFRHPHRLSLVPVFRFRVHISLNMHGLMPGGKIMSHWFTIDCSPLLNRRRRDSFFAPSLARSATEDIFEVDVADTTDPHSRHRLRMCFRLALDAGDHHEDQCCIISVEYRIPWPDRMILEKACPPAAAAKPPSTLRMSPYAPVWRPPPGIALPTTERASSRLSSRLQYPLQPPALVEASAPSAVVDEMSHEITIPGMQPGQNLGSYISTFSGSRAIQNLMDKDCIAATRLAHALIATGEMPYFVEDVYANYAVQKLFAIANSASKEAVLIAIFDQIPSLSRSLQGSLCIQSMMDSSSNDQRLCSIFVKSLTPELGNLILHQNATYVIQRALECFRPKSLAPILQGILVDNETAPISRRTEAWAMVIRLVMDKMCSGVRICCIQAILADAQKFCLHEVAHLVVLHLVLPLMNEAALSSAAKGVVAHHDRDGSCEICACRVLLEGKDCSRGGLRIPALSHRVCCCAQAMSEAQAIVSVEPALALLDAIAPTFDAISMDKYGKKIIIRFAQMDPCTPQADLVMDKVVDVATQSAILTSLLGDRRGCVVLEQLTRGALRHFPHPMRKLLEGIQLILSDCPKLETSLGIKSAKVLRAIAACINAKPELLPDVVPLGLMGLTDPTVQHVRDEALHGADVSLVSISRIDMDSWISWFPVRKPIAKPSHFHRRA